MTTESRAFNAPFVRGEAGVLRGVVVAPPSAAIAAIHPMHGESNAITERAREQFDIFTGRLRAHGVKVLAIEPDPGDPFASLCADGAVLFPEGAFLMRASDLAHRREVVALERLFEREQIPIVGRIEAPGLLDGGDVLLTPDCLYIGVETKRQAETGIPSTTAHGNALGRAQLTRYAQSKDLKVVEVPMASEVRRFRAVASLIDARTLLFAPGLVDASVFAELECIEAPRGEDYAAGVLALGNRRVLANLRFRETIPLLRRAKFAVDAIDLWEFGKIGLTPSTMALAVKRD